MPKTNLLKSVLIPQWFEGSKSGLFLCSVVLLQKGYPSLYEAPLGHCYDLLTSQRYSLVLQPILSLSVHLSLRTWASDLWYFHEWWKPWCTGVRSPYTGFSVPSHSRLQVLTSRWAFWLLPVQIGGQFRITSFLSTVLGSFSKEVGFAGGSPSLQQEPAHSLMSPPGSLVQCSVSCLLLS